MNCPKCNAPNAYIGFVSVECTNPSCAFYTVRQIVEALLANKTKAELKNMAATVSAYVAPASQVSTAPANGWTWHRSTFNRNFFTVHMPGQSRFVFNATKSPITVEDLGDKPLDEFSASTPDLVTPDVVRAAFNGKTFDSQLGPRP